LQAFIYSHYVMAKQKDTSSKSTTRFPPVVAVLGHVDHGKTTLLDAIRKTTIAQREHGGITQKIGASSVTIIHDGIKRRITFIDTPGHETFTNMRTRGARVADIGLLVVSSVDGVMPQTKEAIALLKQAKIVYIVVLTKADMPQKNPEKVKQQLLQENVMLEGYGGDIPVIEVSAKTGAHIQDLLDIILLSYDLNEHNAFENEPLQAVIIESKLDPKSGPKATIIIKHGKVSRRDELVTETTSARVRALINDQNASVNEATVGDAVEVLGFEQVPAAGSIVFNKTQTKDSTIVREALSKEKKQVDENALKLILCADTQGVLEAILAALPSNIHIVTAKTGEISEGDILFAKSTGAIILTFNVKIRNDIAQFARTEKVLLKNYAIIYELLNELQEVAEGKRLALLEQIYGAAKILASFPFEKNTVLGISVMDGRMAKGDKIRLLREEETIGESHIVSVKQGKNPVSKVEKGQEGGILISPFLEFKLGDLIIAHS